MQCFQMQYANGGKKMQLASLEGYNYAMSCDVVTSRLRVYSYDVMQWQCDVAECNAVQYK